MSLRAQSDYSTRARARGEAGETGKDEVRGSFGAVRLPLPALLSQALVAYTIELDNEFERRMPHRTTNHGTTAGSSGGPWLVSMAMWFNCMRFVGEGGTRARELEELARTKTNLNGMERWGYITVAPDPSDRRAKPPRSGWVIRATAKGRRAREVWASLFDEIEKRWEERFGEDAIGRLRESLGALILRFEVELPDCMPILGYGLYSRGPERKRAAAGGEDAACSRLRLPALISRVLLAFAIEFESDSDLSLAISANALRVLDEEGVRLCDLPRRTGVSKEALAVAMGVMLKRRVIVVEPDQSGGRGKIVRLTPKGRAVQDAYRRLLVDIEERWNSRFGEDCVGSLKKLLEALVGDPSAGRSPLLGGLQPYPDGWRAAVPAPGTLPHYPMVLHRGGFPDGS